MSKEQDMPDPRIYSLDPNVPKDRIDRDMATAAEVVNKYGRTA